MKFYIIFIIAILLFSSFLFSQGNVAILDLDAIGITNIEALTLTEELRTKIVNTNKFAVMERERMDQILAEQAFSLSGCTSTECVIEVGEILLVDMMIAGSVGKIGETYTVNLKLFKVETSQIIQSVSERYQGTKDGLLDAVGVAGLKLMGVIPIKQQVVPINKVEETGSGDFFFKSDPDGSRVLIDDKEIEGKTTPFIYEGVKSGMHHIRFIKGDYIAEEYVRLLPGEVNTISVSLKKAKVDLKIISDPPEAQIMVDGIIKGVTPVMINDIDAGNHTITLTYHGYCEYNDTIDVKPDEINRIDIKLSKKAVVSFYSDPTNADIYLNEKYIGKTPFDKYLTKPGNYEISIIYNEFIYKTDKNIESGKEYFINEKLSKTTIFNITSNPPGAEVYFDNNNIGVSPITFKVNESGSHLLCIKKKGYKIIYKTLSISNVENASSINSGKEYSFSYKLDQGNYFKITSEINKEQNNLKHLSERYWGLMYAPLNFKLKNPYFLNTKSEFFIASITCNGFFGILYITQLLPKNWEREGGGTKILKSFQIINMVVNGKKAINSNSSDNPYMFQSWMQNTAAAVFMGFIFDIHDNYIRKKGVDSEKKIK
ncbi:PEGA domain-containing protein, partial [bacterium]|nr:PEGA domain-containing protein [bacterium]